MFSTIHRIDDTIQRDKLRKEDLSKAQKLQAFMKTHCKATHYAFQYKKCSDPVMCQEVSVCLQQSLFLPDPVLDDTKEHYLSFSEVYGKKTTTEKSRPSLISCADITGSCQSERLHQVF